MNEKMAQSHHIVSQKNNSKVLICREQVPISPQFIRGILNFSTFPPPTCTQIWLSPQVDARHPLLFHKFEKQKNTGIWQVLDFDNTQWFQFYYYFRIREALVLESLLGEKESENHHFRLNKKSQRTSDFIGGYYFILFLFF